jgi:Uma2 family endonuclease
MTVDTRVFTADELFQLPDDGSRYELVEGELRKMSPAGADHSAIALLIAARILSHAEQHRLGGRVYGADAGFVVSRNPDTVLAPDAAYVSPERAVGSPRFFPGPPDLAVEVVSPSDRFSEVVAKTRAYLRAGTRAVVIVEPASRLVQVHRASGVTNVTDTLTIDDLLPGWPMTLDDIFATNLPA